MIEQRRKEGLYGKKRRSAHPQEGSRLETERDGRGFGEKRRFVHREKQGTLQDGLARERTVGDGFERS